MLTEAQTELAKDFVSAFGLVALVFLVTTFFVVLMRRWRVAKHVVTTIAVMTLSVALALNIEAFGSENAGPYAIIYGAALGTLGWTFTLYESRSNQRRDFTLQFMREFIQSPLFEEHRQNISQRFPYSLDVQDSDVEALFVELKDPTYYSDGRLPTLYSIIQILNYYEFIASQVKANRIDEAATKEYFGNLSEAAVKKFRPVIMKFKHPQSDVTRDAYPDLLWLVKRWHKMTLS